MKFGFSRPSLRLRIALSYALTAILLAGFLSAATFFSVRSFLETQRVRSTTRQTIFGLIFAREFLEPGARTDPEELVALLRSRGGFNAMVTERDDFLSTSLSLTPSSIPAGLRDLVAQERLGYQFVSSGGERALVYGAPLPPAGTDLYLFYTLDDIDQTMSVLLRVLFVAGIAVVAVAIGLALRVGSRIIRPLAEVSAAAQRVAEGLLETRVTPVLSDEVGVLAASFNQMAAAFQQMLERERRFVANASHELRTPLATLAAASQLLSRHREELSPSAREAVDLLSEDVTSLQRLVQELMEVSEVDAGRAVVHWEEVELRALATAVVQRTRRVVSVEGDAVTCRSDKVRLERILSNLLDNAFEHGRGRDVRIRIARDEERALAEVSDTGPGIAAEDLPHVFDRFFKADRGRTREHGGVGLGLAIALENARLLGGTLEAASAASRTSFTLRVPLTAGLPEEAPG